MSKWGWLLVFVVALFFLFITSAPMDFPDGVVFQVKSGESLRMVSARLKDDNLIRSRIFFEAFVIMHSGDRHIISADYLFSKKTSVFEVAKRLSLGERRLPPVKVTIPEGFSVEDIKNIRRDVDEFGIDAVLNDPALTSTQKRAIEKVYNVQAQVTREQIESTVTQKVAQEGLKSTYTDDELSQIQGRMLKYVKECVVR